MGAKRNWILLRGLARGRGHWGSFAQKMAERFSEDRFEFLDLPGNGERNEEESPLAIADYVKDLRARSEFVKNGENFHILALSLGAMIAVEWIKEYPHEVKKAYLACTSSSNFSSFYERFRPVNYLKAGQMILAKEAAGKEKVILHMIANNKERIDAEFLTMETYSRQYPVKERNMIRQLFAASQYRFPSQAPGDIQLIGSFGDRLVSPNCTLNIAKKWELKANMHPWAGHDIPIDDPQWLIEHLL
ncbi:2-succinyl-6-hydroxy-2,4-cyclohexadiene-1-carboxylate synthase [compost metagenome]